MYRLLVTLFIVLLSAAITMPHASADKAVYRWVDDDGIVHFGNHAPEGVQATEVALKPGTDEPGRPQENADPSPEPDTTAGAEEEAPLSVAEQRRQARAERRQKYNEDRQKMESQCKTMRTQKDFVEPNPRVLVQGEDGNPRRLEDSEREEMLDEANAFLAKNCN